LRVISSLTYPIKILLAGVTKNLPFKEKIRFTGAMRPQEPVFAPVFATTHWSAVVQASRTNSPEAARALEELCRTYWYPLYAYVRRLGHDVHGAQDLTQEFFRKLLEKNSLSIVDRRRGKFRWFLLAAFKGFLANEWDRVRAQKRGGGRQPIALDELTAEQRYRLEPADELTADRIYERRWALTLLEATRARLRSEYAVAGKERRFELLEGSLPGEQISRTHAEAGAELGLSEGAVKVEVHRMKKRYGELLREAVAKTVVDPSEVDEEIRHLIDVLAGR
jgi:DNA-directed RNA polymerase specialized sigma24 family protein